MSEEIGDFISKKLSFNLDGNKQIFKEPTVNDLAEFRKDIREGADEIDASIKFVVKLGVEEGVAESLTLEQLTTIMDFMSGVKKN